jgi:signal transduction histidine kinase
MNQIGIGFLEMVIDNPSIGPDEKELLQKPLEAFMNTSQLIRNVKKLRAANGGGLKLEKICVSNVLARVKKAFDDIPDREVEIRIQYQKDCCVIANGLLTDVFQNIVGNAIKHSPPDKPLTIDIRLDGVERDGVKYCQVAIEDNGPGIPDQRKENIFLRMRRDPGKPWGRGMGLVLVHSLIEDFKGQIRVEDRVSGDYTKGSRFVVLLPAAD